MVHVLDGRSHSDRESFWLMCGPGLLGKDSSFVRNGRNGISHSDSKSGKCLAFLGLGRSSSLVMNRWSHSDSKHSDSKSF